jgi:hypothetical protein
MRRHCSIAVIGLATAGVVTASLTMAAGTLESEQAVALARATLARQSHIAIGKIELVSVEPRTWPNSGLGCAPPGSATLQVITEGYVVTLATPGGNRRVHVAGGRALICDKKGVMPTPRLALPAHNIGGLGDSAREHLARKLGVPLSEIQVAKFTPTQWRNSALECPRPGEAYEERPVRGYALVLRYRDREFTYRADSQHIRPCPAIETE